MTGDEDTASDRPYDDLAMLHAAHLALLARQAPSGGRSVPIDADEAQAFLRRAQATGAVLVDPEERGIAQRIIDYWSADLLSSERGPPMDAEMVTLAPPAGERSDDPMSVARDGHSMPEARQYIRIASLARQWRDTQSDDYLLTGEALEAARQFERDPDIASLIRASTEAERRLEKRRSTLKTRVIWGLSLVVAVLVGLSYATWVAATLAREQAELAREQSELATQGQAAAEAQKRVAERRSDELAEANRVLTELADSREAERTAAVAQFAELQARQRLLDTAISFVVESLVTREASLDSIPTEIRAEVLSSLGARIRSEAIPLFTLAPDVADAVRPLLQDMTLSAFERPLAGFQAQDATDIMVGSSPGLDGSGNRASVTTPPQSPSVLPTLPERLRARAFAGGAPVPYLNYSLVLDAERRYALYAAANLDRRQRAVLPAGSVTYSLDPRLPDDVQPDPSQYPGYLARGLEIAMLVGRNDIAWGPEGSDAALVDQMVQVYPNTVPVLPEVKSAWEAVSAWVQTDHNPTASRVSILSGPVFEGDGTEGGPPAGLWKIAISVQDVTQRQTDAPGVLVVDAFLVEARTDSGTGDPERHRSTVAEIARRTGLVFPPDVVAADRGPALLGTSEGTALAAAVPGLDGPVAEDRRALVQELADAVRDGGLAVEEQAKVVDALVEGLRNVRGASAAGRFNLLFVLSQVPRSNWNRADWQGLTAGARGAVADLEARGCAGETTIGDDTREQLDQLKDVLGLNEGPRQTVYLQFADFPRERAQAMQCALGALGWDLPGEERVPTASGLKQVRHNPGNAADEAAARLLAADIVALGWSGTEAVPVSVIRPGILEIWVGEP